MWFSLELKLLTTAALNIMLFSYYFQCTIMSLTRKETELFYNVIKKKLLGLKFCFSGCTALKVTLFVQKRKKSSYFKRVD